MKILLIGYGSRGDVQPLIALGHGLKNAGYDVAIAAGANFREMVTDAGFGYEAFRTDMHAMMNSASGQAWIEKSSANSMVEAQNMKRMMNEYGATMGEDILRMAQNADILVSGLPTFMLTHAIAQKLGKKHQTIMLAPLNPTADAAATLVPSIPGRKIFANRFSGYIGQYFTYWIFQEASNAYLKSIGQTPMRYGDYTRAYNREVPVIYGISPRVMPRPDDWHDKIFVTGYWFQDAADDWTPSPELAAFLDGGEPPVYIGFGSMSNQDPEGTAKLMIDALKKTRKRGIILSGWAGLKAENLPEDILLLDSAPHDWLFPKMAAVMHHGGAGTTAAALRAGVPNTVVSHMADQPYWGRRVYELGVGAKTIRRHKLNSERLADAITAMTGSPTMGQKAAALGAAIRQEEGVKNAVDVFRALVSNP